MRIAKTSIVISKSKEKRRTEKKHKTHQKDSGKFESLIGVMKNGTNLHPVHKKSGPSKPSAKVHEHKNLVKDSRDDLLKSDKAKKNSNSKSENNRVAKLPLDLSHKTISSKHLKESENHSNSSHFKKESSFDVHAADSKDGSERAHKQPQKIRDLPNKSNSSKHLKESKDHPKLSNFEHVFETQNAPSNLKNELKRTHRNISEVKDSSHKTISSKHLKGSENHRLRSSRLNQNSFNTHVPYNQNRSTSTHLNDEKSSKDTLNANSRFKNIGIRERGKKLKTNRVSFQKKAKSSSSPYEGKEIFKKSVLSSKNAEGKSVNLKESFKHEREKSNLSHFQKKAAFSIPQNNQINKDNDVYVNKSDVHGVQIEKNAVLVNGDKVVPTSMSKTTKPKITRILGDDVHIKIEKGDFSKKNETRFSKFINKVHVDLKRREFKPYKVLPQVSREFAGNSQAKVLFEDGKIEGHEISNHIAHEISKAIIKALENQKPPLKVEIKLNPPQLGKVSITMVEKTGKTFLTINAQNLRTQELLKMATPVIVNQLSNLNFNNVEVQVNAQQWFENDSGGKHGRDNSRREKQNDDRNFRDDFKETYEKEV